MRSAAFRATIGATAWIALGIAAILLYRSEQHIARRADDLRAFDQHAREATDALIDARIGQEAYVAAGQGIGFWMQKVTSSTDRAQTALTTMRQTATAAAQAPLDQAIAAAAEFTTVENRVREYLKSSQLLMAGDVIFSEGVEAAATAARHVEATRQAEHQAFDVTEAAIRKQEAIGAAAATGVAAIVVLLLIPAGRRTVVSEDEEPATAPVSTAVIAPPPPAPAPSSTTAVKFAASMSTDFGRVRDLGELVRVLAKAANVMDASGIMVWMGSPGGGDLRVVLAHGYPADVLSKIPPVPRSADNAAAAAYRSGTLQIVLARPGTSSGAVVAPILSADGCIGALSAEIRHRAETSEEVQALAEIAAAHLAGVLAQAPAEVGDRRAAAQA